MELEYEYRMMSVHEIGFRSAVCSSGLGRIEGGWSILSQRSVKVVNPTGSFI